jgi:hypothetical protein
VTFVGIHASTSDIHFSLTGRLSTRGTWIGAMLTGYMALLMSLVLVRCRLHLASTAPRFRYMLARGIQEIQTKAILNETFISSVPGGEWKRWLLN